MAKLYLFDFDGTISKRDSMLGFVKFINPFLLFYIKAIVFIPVYLLFLLRIINNRTAKHLFLQVFIGKYSQQKLEYFAIQFADHFMSSLKKGAVQYLKEIESEEAETTIAIVSSSLDLWLVPIAKKIGIEHCICTRAKFKNGVYHGIGANCYGKQKAIRIKENFRLEKFQEILAFGDSKGDREMLQLATQRHHNFFK